MEPKDAQSPEPEKNKGGRPPTYDRLAIVERLCRELEQGKTLREICAENDMPCARLVREWCENDKAVSAAVLRAREIGFDMMAEECIEIADDASGDYVEGADGVVRENREFATRSKLRIETRLRLLAKWSKKYSDQPASTSVSVAVGITVMTAEKIADLAARKRASILRNRERMGIAAPNVQSVTETAPQLP